ncbi:Ribosome-binding protein 1 [Papilio xuthus]|uniref:Ribosome-binding protein 1 n=1 Tax=Papilio xuthus TaxID=66420 RepID=A0A194PLQ6_PAPXU|nr:Ribosome-binding protein 1 [Papilio xuthus]
MDQNNADRDTSDDSDSTASADSLETITESDLNKLSKSNDKSYTFLKYIQKLANEIKSANPHSKINIYKPNFKYYNTLLLELEKSLQKSGCPPNVPILGKIRTGIRRGKSRQPPFMYMNSKVDAKNVEKKGKKRSVVKGTSYKTSEDTNRASNSNNSMPGINEDKAAKSLPQDKYVGKVGEIVDKPDVVIVVNGDDKEDEADDEQSPLNNEINLRPGEEQTFQTPQVDTSVIPIDCGQPSQAIIPTPQQNLLLQVDRNARVAQNGNNDIHFQQGRWMQSGTIEGGRLEGGTIEGGRIEGVTIEGGRIEGGTIEGGRIEGGTIEGGRIQGGRIQGGRIQGGKIEGRRIEGGMIQGAMIEGGKIEGSKIEGGMIEGDMIKGGRLEGDRLEGGTIEGSMIEGGLIVGGLIEGGLIEGGMIEGGRIEGDRLDGTRVEDGRILGGTIEGFRIEDGRIQNGRIHNGRIQSGRIQSDRIRVGRIQSDRNGVVRIEGGRIQDGRIEGGRIQSGRIEAGRIQSDRIEGCRIQGGRIEGGRIQDGRIEGGRIQSGRIEASRIESDRIEGGRIQSGSIEGGRIQSGRIEGGRIQNVEYRSQRNFRNMQYNLNNQQQGPPACNQNQNSNLLRPQEIYNSQDRPNLIRWTYPINQNRQGAWNGQINRNNDMTQLIYRKETNIEQRGTVQVTYRNRGINDEIQQNVNHQWQGSRPNRKNVNISQHQRINPTQEIWNTHVNGNIPINQNIQHVGNVQGPRDNGMPQFGNNSNFQEGVRIHGGYQNFRNMQYNSSTQQGYRPPAYGQTLNRNQAQWQGL